MNMAYENPKLGYYMKSIKEFKFSVVGPLKSMVSYCMVSTRIMHMYWVLGLGPFCVNYYLNSAWHGCYQPVALLRSYGRPGCFNSGLQLFCIVQSHLLLAKPHRFKLACQSRTVNPMVIEPGFGSVGIGPSPAGKWNQHLHKACMPKEAWSALKCPGRRLRSHLTSSILDCVPLHSSARLWDLGFQMRGKICSHQKRGHWTTEQPTSYFFL